MQQQLIAGDSLNFLTATPDYPASAGWVLRFRLVPRTAANAPITLISVAEGDEHRTQAAASTTASWQADSYSWSSWVERAGEQYTTASGQITIQPNPRTAAAGTDMRSAVQRALDDARSAYRAFDPTRKRYKIGDREMEFHAASDLLRKIRQLEQELAVERGDPVPGMGGRYYFRAR